MKKEVITKWISEWHLQQRIKAYKKHGARVSSVGIKIRNKIHGFLLNFVVLEGKLSKRQVQLISDKRTATNKPIIYAVTHVGGADIEAAFEAIKSSAWLLLGDAKEIYYNLSGLLLYFNGVVFVETRNKTDRKICRERCLNILNQGGSVLMFPEGAWNISPNQIVYYMYYGAVEMAQLTNAQIIPVGVILENNKYYVNIGKNMDCSNVQNDDKKILTQALRDEMATLQYETMKNLSILNHKDIDSEYYNRWLMEMADIQKATFAISEVYETRFNPNYLTEAKDVFSHLDNLVPTTSNAFLFNKRLK